MSESYLNRELRDDLKAAARAGVAAKSRLRVHDGAAVYPVLRSWPSGFALDPAAAPRLRGLVDIYDGSRHLSTCLIVASAEEDGEMVYEFKRNTAAADRPALDFARDEDAPVGLIGRMPRPA